jgi:hypothetical protein
VVDTILADRRVIVAPDDKRAVILDAIRLLGLVDGVPAEQLALPQSVDIPVARAGVPG